MRTTGAVAAVVALLTVVFVEGIRHLYPSRQAWARLRRVNGARAVRAMRERLEGAAAAGPSGVLVQVLLGLVLVWIAIASLLDKRWWQVVVDVSPYAIVLVALLRMPGALRAAAERMKEYERRAGEDPDAEPGDGGPTAVAL